MNETDKMSAQKRADQIQAFNDELSELESEQILSLSTEQHQKISGYHQSVLETFRTYFDIDASQQEKQLSLGMRITSFLGAVALAASVFFLFFQFWGKFSTTSQVVILISFSIMSLVVTVFVANKDSSGYFTKLFALVAFVCFVLNIGMFGQIFNITPSDNALIVWAALGYLLAYAFNVRLLQVAATLCVVGFVSARVGTWSGWYWIHFGERPENFFPVAILLFLFPLLIDHRRFNGFDLSYRVFGITALLLPMLVLANWGQGSYLNFDADVIESAYQLTGMTLSAALIWLGIRKGWLHVVNTGVTFFVIYIYTKMFDWWWDLIPKYLFFLLIAAIAILCLVILKRIRATDHAATGRTS